MMTGHIFGARCALVFGALSLGSAASAQTLARRVSSAPDGRVQFSYPAREGVCGNGRGYIQTGPNNYSGTWDDSRRMDGSQSATTYARTLHSTNRSQSILYTWPVASFPPPVA